MKSHSGLFGFLLGSPSNGTWPLNAGLYDQRLALNGSAPTLPGSEEIRNQVTVIGESAGAGSIMLQLSAFGGSPGTTPFQRAIIQSPALKPASDAVLYAQAYRQFLAVANVSSLDEARLLSSMDLQNINGEMVGTAPFASTFFGRSMHPAYRSRSLHADE